MAPKPGHRQTILDLQKFAYKAKASPAGPQADASEKKRSSSSSAKYSPACISYVMQNGSFSTAASVERYLLSLSVPGQAMQACLDAGVMNMITNWRAFFKNLERLTTSPFLPEACGEDRGKEYSVRCCLSTCLGRITKIRADLDQELAFLAWKVFDDQHRGAVYLPVDVVVGSLCVLGVPDDTVKHFTDVYLKKHAGMPNYLTTPSIWRQEHAISRWLEHATTVVRQQGQQGQQGHQTMAPADPCDTLDGDQEIAVRTCVHERISCLAGGAGVGKTTTLRGIVQTVAANTDNTTAVICCALTHKARRVLLSKVKPVMPPSGMICTIHSLVLSLRSVRMAGVRRVFLIIDESSMLDYELLSALADGMKTFGEYQLCFVGDPLQLPPIGRGEFFRELLAQRDVGRCVLSKQYRFGQEHTGLRDAADSLRQGTRVAGGPGCNLIITCRDDCQVASELRMIINTTYNTQDDIGKHHIIAWQNVDVDRINCWVQHRLLEVGAIQAQHVDIGYSGTMKFHKGDRVVYIGEKKTGQHAEPLTNSMTGEVTSVAPLTVVFDGEDHASKYHRTFSPAQAARELQLVYCTTVHKAQGSEYPHVVLPCFEVRKMMSVLDRRWLYTALTRAKDCVTMIATPDVQHACEMQVRDIPIMRINIPTL